MRLLKTCLLVVVVLLLLVAAVFALRWRTLLSPEQQLATGLYFRAADETRREAAARPADAQALEQYTAQLVEQGNLGRALYLTDILGVPEPEAARLQSLRKALRLAADESRQGRIYKITTDPAAEPYKELPLGQALMYLEGYHHALLGDWASARNFFSAIEPRQLAPPLRPHHLYYLARSYRLAGTVEQHAEIEALYEKLLAGEATPGLKARARYNLAAWFLSRDYAGERGLERARELREQLNADEPQERWAAQKLDTELAQYYWDHREDDPEAQRLAWELSWRALQNEPRDVASVAPGELLLLSIRDALQRVSGDFPHEIPADGLTDLARSAMLHGYMLSRAIQNRPGQPVLLPLLTDLDPRLGPEHDADLLHAQAILHAAVNDAAALAALVGSPRFNALPAATRAEIRFEYAEVLARAQRWNDAVAQYRLSAELHGPREPQALYARYAVLKDVQAQLDLATAIPLLEQIAERFPASVVTPKAVEELLPLQIHRGRTADARALARRFTTAPALETEDGVPVRALQRSFANLSEVCRFWLAYLAGSESEAREQLGAIERTTWNYYEVVALSSSAESESLVPDPADGQAEALAALLSQPEDAGEYLAGLGLSEAAAEHYSDVDDPDNQLLLFHTLHRMWMTQGLPGLQWNAMELLESGRIELPALAAYALGLAYPTPYRDEVDAAAGASGIERALIYAVMKKESDFRPEAASGVGAKGLMQLMPGTARELSGRSGIPADAHTRLGEPAINIRLGTAYLAQLSAQLAGSAAPAGPRWTRYGPDSALRRAMLHSYNGGPGNYQRWRGLYPQADAVLLADLVPNEENEGFAKRVWKYYLIYSALLNK